MPETIIRRQAISQLHHQQDLHPVIKAIYEHRGIQCLTEMDKELNALLPFDTLMGIEPAIELIYKHLQQQSRIIIVGDFDADGATSSAVAVTALRSFGAKYVNYLVPNRFEYGYGLTPEIVAVADQSQPQLIITVDNGIASIEGVAAANERGIEVLITDHHLPADELPKAAAIVNPNQRGDEFPSKNLAGVGVIFYVMLALRRHLQAQQWFEAQKLPMPNMGNLLDLVSLGTVADVVPLDKNNRVLVHQGIKRIRAGLCRPGIKALIDVAGRKQATLCAADMGFAIGPRLNAAGRLDDMSIGIECLLTEDYHQAQQLAQQLDVLNRERRMIETDMQQQALQCLKKLHLEGQASHLPVGLCLYDESWHQGVIGILASRIKDKFHRPVIAFAPGDEQTLKGSARSVAGLHIRDVLDTIANQNPGLIDKFGGHAMAAGLSIATQHFKTFQQKFAQAVSELLDPSQLKKQILSDGLLADEHHQLPFAEQLQQAGPWGQQFPEPIFDGEFQMINQRIVGNKHLKLVLQPLQGNKMLDAIAFNVNLQEWPNHRCERVHCAYRLDINEFQGVRSVQLMIEHIEAVA